MLKYGTLLVQFILLSFLSQAGNSYLETHDEFLVAIPIATQMFTAYYFDK